MSALILVVSSCSSPQPESARPDDVDDAGFADLIETFDADQALRFPLIGFETDFGGTRATDALWRLDEATRSMRYTQRWSVSTLQESCSSCPETGIAVVTSQLHHNSIGPDSQVQLSSAETVSLGDGLEYWLPDQETTLDFSEPGRHCLIVAATAQITIDGEVIASADVDQVVLIDVGGSVPNNCDLASDADTLEWLVTAGESFGCGFGRFLPADESGERLAEINGCATDQLLVAVPVDETGRVLSCCFSSVFYASSTPNTTNSASVTFSSDGRWRSMLLSNLGALSATDPELTFPYSWPSTDPLP